MKKRSAKQTLSRVVLYVFIIAMVIVTLYPYFVMLTYGARTDADITSGALLPTRWIWENYIYVLVSDHSVARYILNSLIVAAGATAIAIVCGVPAAYALSRMKFKGHGVFLAIIIVSQMFAPVVLVLGISKVLLALKLNDTLLGLILVDAAFNQAFAVWLLRGTFNSISPEMEQAATIDGCSRFQAMMKILLPVAAPGIVTTLIYVFINAWNEYTIAMVMISSTELQPITVGLTSFVTKNMTQWNYMFASSLFATIPVVILFICIEKHLVSGLTSGGVKG